MTEASSADHKCPEQVRLEQEARISLLEYYSSRCTAHGTNILTISIVFFTYMQTMFSLFSFSSLGRVLNSLFISGFLTLTFYQIVRLLWWARLTQIVLLKTPPEGVDPLLYRLDNACQKGLKNEKENKRFFDVCIAALNEYRKWIFVVFWITLWVCVLLLSATF